MKTFNLFMVLCLVWGTSVRAQSGPPPSYPPADQNIPLDPDGTPKPIKEVHRDLGVNKHGAAEEGAPKTSKRLKLPLPPATVMPSE